MFYNKKIETVLNELNTSYNGLTKEEAEKRNKLYGKNELPKKAKDSIF